MSQKTERRDASAGNGVTSHKVGVADIAEKADVSIGTVSNYLNYPERVSAALKTRIKASIDELGYIPKRRRFPVIASGGNGGDDAQDSPALVGYVMTDIEHTLFTAVFEGIQESCEDQDMQVLGANAYSDRARQSELVEIFIRLGVSGILVSTVHDSHEDIMAARRAGIPIVLIDHSDPPSTAPVCSSLENNVSSGRLAADELIRTGCRKLAFASHSFDYQAIQDRFQGVQNAVRAADVPISLDVIDSNGILFQDGYQIGLQLSGMDRDDLPDGIIAGTDQIAGGIVTAITHENKLHIPEDISIVGTEGSFIPEGSPIPLTTINAPGVEMGRKAMDLLLDEIQNPQTHVHSSVLLEPSLRLRSTTRA
ncbi:MAG: LacI family DNA-binding transcriptional regulator [Bifidobacterium psychraerophilum]|uniref:LacI family DNA-binding transcriptional regulator n=1 Tax=Bifidobacterium psychraerophilum TaxID=218140 RepID=UPI0039E891BB